MSESFSKASKMTLMELTMMGEYGVSDKVGVCEFIERLSDHEVQTLASRVIHSEKTNQAKVILEKEYNDSLKLKNNSLSIISESAWLSNRDNVLMEADEDPRRSLVDIQDVLKKGGPPALATYIAHQYMVNPHEASRKMANIKLISADLYEKVRNIIENKTASWNKPIVFPSIRDADSKVVSSLEHYRNLLATAAKHSKEGEKIPPTLLKDIEAAKKASEEASKTHKTLVKGKLKNVIKSGTRPAIITVSVILGITAAAIAIYKLWQEYMSNASRFCRGKKGNEKKICMLTHKIGAAEKAIAKWREVLPTCKDKDNPEKCTHSVQTQIWNWEKRKRRYQERLASISKRHINSMPPPSTPSSPKPGAKKSKGGGSVFGRMSKR